MRKVRNLNTNSVSEHYEMLTFYYGTKDKWVPLDYHYDMKYYIADLYEKDGKSCKGERVKLDTCEPPLEHAFVIFKKQTSIISNKISEWITDSYDNDTFENIE